VTISPIGGDLVQPLIGRLGSGPIVLPGPQGTLCLQTSDLSTHALFLGSTGSGKTNAIRHVLRGIIGTLTEDDVVVVFDTKGDYVQEFYREDRKDVVIAHRPIISPKSETRHFNYVTWNLFEEIRADEPEFRGETTNEISKTMFEDLLTTDDPFFPRAAQEVTQAVMTGMMRETPDRLPTNADFIAFIRDYDRVVALLRRYEDLEYALWYIRDRTTQSQGVISFTHVSANEILTGAFAKAGDFSIRDFIRSRGKRVAFLEYDVRTGGVIGPVFRMLFDLAIKESLGRGGSKGNVYFVVDELGRLPNLHHLDDGVSFGRQLGVKFVVGTQNVNQLYDSYGKERASSIFSNFGTVFVFKLNDQESRDVAASRYGPFMKRIVMSPLNSMDPPFQHVATAKSIEDLTISTLAPNVMIACLPGMPPKVFEVDYIPSPLDP
jgi:type IV secretory pathway TraG/TraD family ATPase VirD4